MLLQPESVLQPEQPDCSDWCGRRIREGRRCLRETVKRATDLSSDESEAARSSSAACALAAARALRASFRCFRSASCRCFHSASCSWYRASAAASAPPPLSKPSDLCVQRRKPGGLPWSMYFQVMQT